MKVLRLTEGNGASLAVGPIGGPGVEALVSALGKNGILVPYGVRTAEPTPYPLVAALERNLTVRAFTMPFLTRDPVRLEQGEKCCARWYCRWAFQASDRAHFSLRGNYRCSSVYEVQPASR